MPSNDSTQNTLVTYAVLTGLTPLIPIPFVDDMVYSYFLRSMVQQLAGVHGVQLSASAVQTLVTQKGSGCALGCAGAILLYPLKKIFRKIFFFLEWKRAADIISHTFYQGFLIDSALRSGRLQPDNSANVRAAIDVVLEHTNTSLITRAAYGVVSQSKSALKAAGRLLVQYLPGVGRKPSEAEVARQVSAVEEEEKQQVRGVIAQLQAAIANLPAEHLEQLRGELEQELG